jgi:hypothetical protein
VSVKAINASNAGASAVLICNDVAGLPDGSLASPFAPTLPVLGLTPALGLEFGATFGSTLRMFVDQTPLPTGVPAPARWL